MKTMTKEDAFKVCFDRVAKQYKNPEVDAKKKDFANSF